MSRILAAISGGVDSASAALKLIEEGHEVEAAILRLHGNAEDSIKEAEKVAAFLGIPLHVLDERDFFRNTVIKYFVETYENCMTPNPCIYCNRHCKFPKILEFAEANGFDYIATGHYARIEEINGQHCILRGTDPKKDQSYMLYRLSEEQLSKIIFPLGALTKEEVRKYAESKGLTNANAPDSQDICFLPEGDYGSFVEARSEKGKTPGEFTDTEGRVMGTHKGLIHYTVGQRKGLGLALPAPMYVMAKDREQNRVILCSDEELYKHHVAADKIRLYEDFPDNAEEAIPVTCKIRYSHNENAGKAYVKGEQLFVNFESPVRAPAPGQSLVMYEGDRVLGGGIICRS
ncbi:MAG: tRNA 2-thiouridine(34) synthase MnmA [Parasporobacterium sp.]|nr:tRNA 2-thiouridine(34) synthase MnmA [Parasporobacterium sp.]